MTNLKMMRTLFLTLLGALLVLIQTASADGLLKSQPSISQNPNPKVPLAAIVQFDAAPGVSTSIVVSEGGREWQIDFDNNHDPSFGLPILGLRADRTHTLVVSVTDAQGDTETATTELTYRTPPLPPTGRRFPSITVNRAESVRMEPGFTLLSVRRNIPRRNIWMTPAQRKFITGFSLLIGLDALGEVVWYYESDTRISGINRLQNGNLFFHLSDNRSVEIDMLGNELQTWYAADRPQGPLADAIPIQDASTLHHQPHQMPSGDFLAFTANPRQIENYYTTEFDTDAPRKTQWVMGDRIIEFTLEGEQVWSWDSFEYLDPFRVGYGLSDAYWIVRGFPDHLDWTHGNGVTYDEKNDLVIFSLRMQDAIFAVERSTGRIRWILGEHSDWPEELQDRLLEPVGDLRWPYHAHNPRMTTEGNIVVFDNGIFQKRPFHGDYLPPDQTYSRGVEFEVDTASMTVRQVWASDSELNEDSCNSWAMGDAHKLPATGNHLVVYALCVPRIPDLTYDIWDTSRRQVDEYPYGGRIREFSAKGSERVFDVDIGDNDDVLNWEVYGGLRAPSLYPSGINAQIDLVLRFAQ